jgi:hypothetical protein
VFASVIISITGSPHVITRETVERIVMKCRIVGFKKFVDTFQLVKSENSNGYCQTCWCVRVAVNSELQDSAGNFSKYNTKNVTIKENVN